MPEYKGYCDTCGFDCCCDIEAEQRENGWGDYAPKSACVSCGALEAYEGQCPCYVAEDLEGVEVVDRAIEMVGGIRAALDGGVLHLVFGAAGDPLTADDEAKIIFPTAEEAAAFEDVRTADDPEVTKAAYVLLASKGHIIVDVLAFAVRFEKNTDLDKIEDDDICLEILNEVRAKGIGITAAEKEDLAAGKQPEPITASTLVYLIRTYSEATAEAATTGVPNPILATYTTTRSQAGPADQAGATGVSTGAGGTSSEVLPAFPEEPYNDGWCWFLAIAAEARRKMWDEVDCAKFASLREINQLGRTYGFSRDRLAIRRVAPGKYHFVRDVAGEGDSRRFEQWMDEIYSPNGMHSRAKTGLFGMPYRNFAGRMKVASEGPWCEVGQFLTVVSGAMARDFSKVTERRAVRDEFAKIDRTCPFALNQHFPSHDTYIWLTGGDWPNKMQQLYSALAYQEPSVEDNRSGQAGGGAGAGGRGGAGGSGQQGNSFGYNDAATAYYNALRNMQNQITNLQGVYDRQSIENEFNAQWAAATIREALTLAGDALRDSDLYVNHAAPGRWTWTGVLNDYVVGDDVGEENMPRNGQLVLWSVARVGGHRARTILQVDRHGGILPVTHGVEATAN